MDNQAKIVISLAKQLAWLQKRNINNSMFVLSAKIALLECGYLLDVKDLKYFDDLISTFVDKE